MSGPGKVSLLPLWACSISVRRGRPRSSTVSRTMKEIRRSTPYLPHASRERLRVPCLGSDGLSYPLQGSLDLNPGLFGVGLCLAPHLRAHRARREISAPSLRALQRAIGNHQVGRRRPSQVAQEFGVPSFLMLNPEQARHTHGEDTPNQCSCTRYVTPTRRRRFQHLSLAQALQLRPARPQISQQCHSPRQYQRWQLGVGIRYCGFVWANWHLPNCR